jgi:outer membrane immunogenic protein
MQSRTYLAASAALVLTAAVMGGSAALAADIPLKAPRTAAAQVWSWTGLYGGIHGGYGWGDNTYSFAPGAGFVNQFAPTVGGGSFGTDMSGGVFGGHLGFNQQAGNWVAGLEGAFTWTGLDSLVTNPFSSAIIPGTATYKTDLEWAASITPRIGVASQNWLVYAKGGLAAGRVNSDLYNTNTPTRYQENEIHIGWTLGGGVEYAVTPNWIFGVEYNYYDLGSQQYGTRSVPGGFGQRGGYDVDLTYSTVLARLSYKLNESGRPAAAYAAKAPLAATQAWSGFYIGGHGGYGWGDATHTFAANNANPAPAGEPSFKQSPDGGLLGGHLGYNQQYGNWVLGLEGAFTWSGLKETTINPFAADGIPGAGFTNTHGIEIEWLASVTPRIGVASQNWLVYAKGGLAAASIENTFTSNFGGGTVPFYERNYHLGWTVGAGVEYALTTNWILGVEYNYYDLGTQRNGGTYTSPFAATIQYDSDVTVSSVLARLSYKFGSPAVIAKY